MNSSPPRDVASLLDLSARVEQAHARLYRALSEVHAPHARIAALWAKTAAEEEGHSAQFRLAASGYHSAITAMRIDVSAVHQMLQFIESMVSRVRTHPPSIVNALRLAIELEESMAVLHLDQVAEFARASDRNLFRAMMAADRQHVEALRDALREYEAGAENTG